MNLTATNPESGSNDVAFQCPATSGRDCLYQDLTTVAGPQYTGSSWVDITAVAGSNIGLDVQWDENKSGQTALDNPFYSAPTNLGPTGYAQFSYSETPPAPPPESTSTPSIPAAPSCSTTSQ
jgi:hypothetical protein